jgi:predicted kinase
MNKPSLYLFIGLPGSGKTTAAAELSKITGAVHLSSDSFRLSLFETPTFSQNEHDSLYKMLDYMCELLLQSGTSVVYDANLNRYSHRKEKYLLAKKTGADCRLFWLNVHRDMAKKRRIDTQHPGLVPKHENAHDMFERIADIFEPPHKNEPYTELDGTKITRPYISAFL